MEWTEWMDKGLDAAEARFLMLTAITHHRFSSPNWGEHEVRKLHAELTEIDMLTTQAAVDHYEAGPSGAGRERAEGQRRSWSFTLNGRRGR